MSLPLVSRPGDQDFHIKLKLCEPWRPGTQGYLGDFHDVFDVSVGWNRGEPSTLQFSTYKTDEAAKLLQRDDRPNPRGGGIREYSVVVLLWDWRRGTYVEPDNSRFIVSQWDENMIDGTNAITYTCVQEIEVLKKAVLMRARNDVQLNNAYDKAKEDYEEAEREYDQLMSEGVRLANEIKEDRFGHERGDIILGYGGTKWITRQRGPKLKWGTIMADTKDNRLKIYHPGTKRWLGLRMVNTETDRQRERLVAVSRGVRAARIRMRARRDDYARAAHAARNTSRDGVRYFHKVTPARLLQRAWMEAGRRDAQDRFAIHPNPDHYDQQPVRSDLRYQLKGIYRDWTTDRHSKNGLWHRATTVGNWEFPLGISWFDMMQDFRERGEIDWTVRGNTLSLVPYGQLEVDQTDRVALRIDDGTEEATERGSRLEHFSVSFVVAGDGYGYSEKFGPNLSAMGTPWGRHEGTISESSAENRKQAIGRTRKTREEKHYREIVDSQRRMTVNPYGAIPGIDFQPHHWVSVWDHEGAKSRRMVDQIILTWDGEGSPEAVITFGTRRQRRATTFARTIAKTIGGKDHVQGHIPMDARITPPEIPTEALHAPMITSLSAALRVAPDTGRPSVVLRAQWAAENLPEPEDLSDEDGSNEADDDGTTDE